MVIFTCSVWKSPAAPPNRWYRQQTQKDSDARCKRCLWIRNCTDQGVCQLHAIWKEEASLPNDRLICREKKDFEQRIKLRRISTLHSKSSSNGKRNSILFKPSDPRQSQVQQFKRRISKFSSYHIKSLPKWCFLLLVSLIVIRTLVMNSVFVDRAKANSF